MRQGNTLRRMWHAGGGCGGALVSSEKEGVPVHNDSDNWPENSNISAWQIELFHEENPGKCFPSYTIATSLNLKAVAEILSLPEQSTDEVVWRFIDENGESIGEHEQDNLESLLLEGKLNAVGGVCIWTTHFGSLDDMPCFSISDLLKIMEYVYLPSTSDLYIFQQELKWCIALSHSGWRYSRIWRANTECDCE